MSNIDKDVQELLKNPNVKISDLQGPDKDRFNRLRVTAQMFYDTDKYKCFYDRVTKYCQALPSPLPGTIGGYLCGCLASKNFIDPTCGPLCVDALAAPKGADDQIVCGKMVIMATTETTVVAGKTVSNYKFTVIRDGTKEPAYLFLDVADIHSFKGFTTTEKKELEKYNIQTVKLFGTSVSAQGTTYPQLTTDAMTINDLKSRRTNESSYFGANGFGFGYGIGIGIFILILIIIFLLVFCGGRYFSY